MTDKIEILSEFILFFSYESSQFWPGFIPFYPLHKVHDKGVTWLLCMIWSKVIARIAINKQSQMMIGRHIKIMVVINNE